MTIMRVTAVWLSIAGLLLTVATSFGQGTVMFGNASTLQWPYPADRNVRFGSSFNAVDPALAGMNVTSNALGYNFSGLHAQLYYSLTSSTDINSFTPVSSSKNGLSTFKSSTVTTPGSWFSKTATLDGFYSQPGEVIYLSVVVWDSNLSTDALSAAARSGAWGTSGIFAYESYTPPFPDSFAMDNLRAFEINIPEPSVLALAGLGGMALLLARARRRV